MADNFTAIPNAIDDSSLDVYQFRIWHRIKRRGVCFESQRNMAKSMKMSVGKVNSTIAWLLNEGWIVQETDQKSNKIGYAAVVPGEQTQQESVSPDEQTQQNFVSPHEHVSPHERFVSPHERHLKKNHKENTTVAHVRLCKKFLMLTGIDPPHETTDDYADRWQRPFDVWLQRFGDVATVEEKLATAVSLHIDKGLRYSSPKSFMKTIANEHAGNGIHQPNGNGASADKNQAMENIRKAVTTYGAKKYKQAMETLGESERAIVKSMASSWRDVCMMDKQTFQVKYYQALKGA